MFYCSRIIALVPNLNCVCGEWIVAKCLGRFSFVVAFRVMSDELVSFVY